MTHIPPVHKSAHKKSNSSQTMARFLACYLVQFIYFQAKEFDES